MHCASAMRIGFLAKFHGARDANGDKKLKKTTASLRVSNAAGIKHSHGHALIQLIQDIPRSVQMDGLLLESHHARRGFQCVTRESVSCYSASVGILDSIVAVMADAGSERHTRRSRSLALGHGLFIRARRAGKQC